VRRLNIVVHSAACLAVLLTAARAFVPCACSDNDEEEWDAKQIARDSDGQQRRQKWVGWDALTWKPLSNLTSPSLLQNFAFKVRALASPASFAVRSSRAVCCSACSRTGCWWWRCL
jgi:hypothetical protein